MQKYKRPLPEGFEDVSVRSTPELRYLRWDYLVKAENPKDSEILKREDIIRSVARNAYRNYRYEFSFMGVEIEDLENIARVHLISYLGLYSKTKGKEFPTEAELKSEEKGIYSFLSQRLLESANIFRSYCKTQAGYNFVVAYKRTSGDTIPSTESLLNSQGNIKGWKLLSRKEFNQIKNHFLNIRDGEKAVIAGELHMVASTSAQIVDSKDTYDIFEYINSNYPTPEEILISAEEGGVKIKEVSGVELNISLEERLSLLVDMFKERDTKSKVRFLKRLKVWMDRNSSKKEKLDGRYKLLLNLAKRYTMKLKKERDGARLES